MGVYNQIIKELITMQNDTLLCFTETQNGREAHNGGNQSGINNLKNILQRS